MKMKLQGMPAEEFQEQKNSLQKKWLEADKNLKDEVSRFISHINSGHWDFLRSKSSNPLIVGRPSIPLQMKMTRRLSRT
jgi:insulysin